MRNWGTNKSCHRCKVAKGGCFLRLAGAGSGSPSISVRQRGNLAVAGGAGAAKPAASFGQAGGAEKEKAENARLQRRLQDLEAKVVELGGQAAGASAEQSGEDARAKVLRAEIAALEKITGVETALGDKRAELLAIQVAKREAKPLDSRARDIEKVVEGKRKAVEKQQQLVADLKGNLVLLQEEIAAAVAKEQLVKDELAKVEAEKAGILRRLADEAAVEAKLELPLQPKVLMQGLASLAGQMVPAHWQDSGLTRDQLKAALHVLTSMCQEPLQVPLAAAAISSGTVPSPQQVQQQQQGQLQAPQQLPAPVPLPTGPQEAGGASAAQDGEGDEDMFVDDGEILASTGASPEELDVFKSIRAKLREKGALASGRTGRKVHKEAVKK